MSEIFRYLEDERYSVVTLLDGYNYRVRDGFRYMGWITKTQDNFFFARHDRDNEDTYKRFNNFNDAVTYTVQQDKVYNA